MLQINNHQRSIIIGTLLGDGFLERNGKFVRLHIDHSIKQKEYLYWKYRELKTFVPSKPRIIISYHRKAQKEYRRLHFATYSLDVFEYYWKIFYSNNRKAITNLIFSELKDPLSLAVWYMDDGYKRNDCDALRFSTESFSSAEQKLLQKVLAKNFGIKAVIHRKSKWWNLYIPHRETLKFIDLVSPYIIPSLRYKITLKTLND